MNDQKRQSNHQNTQIKRVFTQYQLEVKLFTRPYLLDLVMVVLFLITTLWDQKWLSLWVNWSWVAQSECAVCCPNGRDVPISDCSTGQDGHKKTNSFLVAEMQKCTPWRLMVVYNLCCLDTNFFKFDAFLVVILCRVGGNFKEKMLLQCWSLFQAFLESNNKFSIFTLFACVHGK